MNRLDKFELTRTLTLSFDRLYVPPLLCAPLTLPSHQYVFRL